MSRSEVWDDIILNRKQHGHIVTGAPVFYTSAYHPFFEDARQADWEAVDNLLARSRWSRTWVV